MKTLISRFVVVVLIATLGSGIATAQSSGSFSAMGTGASCQISRSDGTFSGGYENVGSFTASVQTSNANGLALLIRPSLDTGLYTDTNVSASNKNSSTGISTATADVGIKVCVTVDGSSANVGPTGGANGDGCVIYDQRFQQLSTSLFNTMTNCGTTVTGTVVPCFIDLIESTLSAHSYDFVAYNLGQGNHAIQASWSVFGTNNNTLGGNTMACVGPGLMTVTQVKNFSQNTSLSF
jgi:hypothetical protein